MRRFAAYPYVVLGGHVSNAAALAGGAAGREQSPRSGFRAAGRSPRHRRVRRGRLRAERLGVPPASPSFPMACVPEAVAPVTPAEISLLGPVFVYAGTRSSHWLAPVFIDAFGARSRSAWGDTRLVFVGQGVAGTWPLAPESASQN